MRAACAAQCHNTHKVFLAIFLICGISIMILYNNKLQEIKPRKRYEVQRNKKYILQWTKKTLAPFSYMESGNAAFVKNLCKHTNCFVTDNVTFVHESEFDAIVFNGRDVVKLESSQIPTSRASKQKYIFAATESADRFPVCNEMYDNFFNWTWTYKLESDLRWGYITIHDMSGKKVGPAIDMKWPEKMDPVSDDLKLNLSRKSKAAAWFVSHCNTNSKREEFVANVSKELKKYGWDIDVYGACGTFKCPRSNWRECDKMLKNEYFFYFSLENSFSEDYVTEKLLTALNNYAVPVVYGSANYSRFLPDGSYLDGRKLGPKKLALVMNELIADKPRYYEFFRWRNHFTYADTHRTDVCTLCEVLNDEQMVNTASVWKDFRKWWNGESHIRCS
ncbi:alpha-(1,3)-fucosyltransferase C-like [Epargyreus clarus]|uniref:alpha-(1,3)-fucosyltransferase C-like n=1 Tax=Epargyreus clarus TaxID=520877 RepID=UPI003C2AFF8F